MDMNFDMNQMMQLMQTMMMNQMMQMMQSGAMNMQAVQPMGQLPVPPSVPTPSAPAVNLVENSQVQDLQAQIAALQSQVKELQSSLDIAKHTAEVKMQEAKLVLENSKKMGSELRTLKKTVRKAEEYMGKSISEIAENVQELSGDDYYEEHKKEWTTASKAAATTAIGINVILIFIVPLYHIRRHRAATFGICRKLLSEKLFPIISTLSGLSFGTPSTAADSALAQSESAAAQTATVNRLNNCIPSLILSSFLIQIYNAPHHFSPGNIITDRASAKENDGVIPMAITRQVRNILCILNLLFVMTFNVH